jgi:hypothetical protein
MYKISLYFISFEINAFNQRLLSNKQNLVCFERHEADPEVKFMDDLNQLNKAIY